MNVRQKTSRRAERLGFALPMVIIVIFVLAGGLAAGFAMTRSERAIDDAGRADSYAQTNAETALQRALTDRPGMGLAAGIPPATDSVRLTETNGYADVIVTQLRPVVGTDQAVYLIRSHGFSTASHVSSTPSAEYTVTQLATWQSGTMQVQSAFTSLTGIQKNGTSGTIDGRDDCVAGVLDPLWRLQAHDLGHIGRVHGYPAVALEVGLRAAMLRALQAGRVARQFLITEA